MGSLYILDEPSIGLHSRDTDQLIHVLRSLQQLGKDFERARQDADEARRQRHAISVNGRTTLIECRERKGPLLFTVR